MKYLKLGLFIFLAGLITTTGCVNTEEPESDPTKMQGEKSPRITLKRLRNLLRQEDWKYVYLLMSSRTRKLYTRSRIKTFLNKTKPGILERYRLMTWNITDQTLNPDDGTGTLTLRHPTKTDYSQTYRFVLENEIWRLDWSLADLLEVPRSVEREIDLSDENDERPDGP